MRKNRRALMAVLDSAFAEATLEEWAARFQAEDVWWQVVQQPADVSPIKVFGASGRTPVRSPELGESNARA